MYIEMDCPCQGKNLDKLLQPLILCILAQGGHMHGFAILKEIGKIPRFEDKAPDEMCIRDRRKLKDRRKRRGSDMEYGIGSGAENSM